MTGTHSIRILRFLGALALVGLFSAQAAAATLTLQTRRNTLNNVNDVAGLWQHEGGEILYQGNRIGHYATTRRVTNGGTTQQNTAMLTMTIFLYGSGAPPINLTLQGAHDFTSGRYIGSVSAASSSLTPLNGATFAGNTASDTLVLTY